MRDKLEVGMYVRTKHNGIGKIVEYINDPTNYFFKCYKLDRNCFNCEEYITESDVIGEPSHNPIDLIEVGDLIEHKKIGIKQIKDKHDKYIWYSKNHNSLTCDVEDAITYEAFKSEFEVGNISILTKQQFESMSYKLED